MLRSQSAWNFNRSSCFATMSDDALFPITSDECGWLSTCSANALEGRCFEGAGIVSRFDSAGLRRPQLFAIKDVVAIEGWEMGNSRFFDRPPGLTVAEIISLTGTETSDPKRLSHLIRDVAPAELAGPHDLTFIESNKYLPALATTHAGACLMPQRFESKAPPGLIVLRTNEPYRAFVAVHRKLYPQSLRPTSLFETSGIFEGATIHPTARLESDVTVDPGAVIGPRAEIGAGSMIGATAVIGPDVLIGRDCAIGAGCTIMHSLIGDRVVIHPGCRIGQDGFGYTTDAAQQKIPQTGRVIIQNDVEIGAGTTIDRGGIRDTVIGESSKIDNSCQIGHNVVIGRHCIVVAQS